MHLAICIPSRNRTEALVESIVSAIRVISGLSSSDTKFSILVRQNNDLNCVDHHILTSVESLLGYLIPPDILRIKSNASPVFMHENCELLICDARDISATHVLILPDRRLLTKALFTLIAAYDHRKHNIAVFDNQSYWLSCHHLLKTRDHGQIKYHTRQSQDLFSDIYHCRFDGLTPRLYNCLVSIEYFEATRRYFGSYIAGPCPDISFQFRSAFLPSSLAFVTDIPVIATNARHASRTVSNTGIPNAASTDKKNITEQRSIFGLHSTIVYVGCLGHITDYVGESTCHLFASPAALLSSVLWEMSCPQTSDLFNERLHTILDALLDADSRFFRRLCWDERHAWYHRFLQLPNISAELQQQPLEHDLSPLLLSSLDRLVNIEP